MGHRVRSTTAGRARLRRSGVTTIKLETGTGQLSRIGGVCVGSGAPTIAMAAFATSRRVVVTTGSRRTRRVSRTVTAEADGRRPAKSGRSSISSLAVSRFALSLHMWISAPGERATFPYKTIADPLAFWN